MDVVLDAMVLRRPADEDAADALLLCTDPEVELWNAVPDVVDVETALAWCRRGADWSDGRHATWHAADGASRSPTSSASGGSATCSSASMPAP